MLFSPCTAGVDMANKMAWVKGEKPIVPVRVYERGTDGFLLRYIILRAWLWRDATLWVKCTSTK